MKKNKFLLIKGGKYIKYSDINITDSFDVKKKKEGIIKFYNENIIDDIINKAIESLFKKLLSHIMELDDENPDGLLLCLNETEKFKRELINKYEKFLDKKKREFNKKKIELIEKDLKDKLVMYRIVNTKNNLNYYEDEEFEEERHHTR